MKNLLLALAISLGIVACGDAVEGINPDPIDEGSDEGSGDVPCEEDGGDEDNDGVCGVDDVCADGDDAIDTDGDSIPDDCDGCPSEVGEVCATDSDDDGVDDSIDNCIDVVNEDQADSDSDSVGDACEIVVDTDSDDDGVDDIIDNCDYTANRGQADVDGDGLGDACDEDFQRVCNPDEFVVCVNADGSKCHVCSDNEGKIQFNTDWVFDADGNYAIDFRIDGVVVTTICNESVGELRSGIYYHEAIPPLSSDKASCTITGATPGMGYTITFIVAE